MICIASWSQKGHCKVIQVGREVIRIEVVGVRVGPKSTWNRRGYGTCFITAVTPMRSSESQKYHRSVADMLHDES